MMAEMMALEMTELMYPLLLSTCVVLEFMSSMSPKYLRVRPMDPMLRDWSRKERMMTTTTMMSLSYM